MKKIIEFMDQNKKKWWFSLLLNAVLLWGLLFFFCPLFETNDDTTIYELTGGAKGIYDSHTFFIHIFVGQILKILYQLVPTVQWYTVAQYAVMFASFTALSYVLLNRLQTGMAAVVFGTIYFYFAYEGFVILQFSKTAGYAACAGILLMFHGLERLIKAEKNRFLTIFLGMLLALAGCMYRYKEFFLCAALMSGIGVYRLQTLRRELKFEEKIVKSALKTIFLYVTSFVFLFGLAAGLVLLDNSSYDSNEQWKEYREFNDMRSNLLDYGFPDYEENKETYEALGITKGDYNLYKSGNHADPKLFDREVIETLTKLCQRKEVNRGFVREYFDTFPLGFFEIYVFTCFLVIFCYWIFWGRKGIWEWTVLAYEAAVVGLVYGYLFYMDRYLVRRTETALWLAVIFVVVWMLDQTKAFFTGRTAMAFCACVLAFNLEGWRDELRISPDQKERQARIQAQRGFLNVLTENKEYLYLAKLGTVSTFFAYDPFDIVPFGSQTNICKLGGWEYGAPSNDFLLEQYEVENPYEDMIDHPKVVVIDDKVNVTLDYLRMHYCETIEADLVKEAGGRKFYSFRSADLDIPEEECRDADEQVVFTCDQEWSGKKLTIRGRLYRQGTNSFTQRVYLRITDAKTGEVFYRNVTAYQAEELTDLYNGQFGRYEQEISLKDTEFSQKTVESGRYQMELILETENGKERASLIF